MILVLTNWDHQQINRDISRIISDWPTTIEVWTLLPKEQQPGWNDLMKEIVGDPVYNKQTLVSERRDIHGTSLNTNVAGDKYDGEILLLIPVVQPSGVTPSIDDESLIIIDGDYKRPWRIRIWNQMPGEFNLRVIRMVGGR